LLQDLQTKSSCTHLASLCIELQQGLALLLTAL